MARTYEELKTVVDGLLADSDLFICKNVMAINHKPHRYVIGARHVTWASRNSGGMLSEAAIERAEKEGVHCEYPSCRVPFKDHTYVSACFLQLKRNCTKEEAQEALQAIVQATSPELEGIVFVETPEKFRIG